MEIAPAGAPTRVFFAAAPAVAGGFLDLLVAFCAGAGGGSVFCFLAGGGAGSRERITRGLMAGGAGLGAGWARGGKARSRAAAESCGCCGVGRRDTYLLSFSLNFSWRWFSNSNERSARSPKVERDFEI